MLAYTDPSRPVSSLPKLPKAVFWGPTLKVIYREPGASGRALKKRSGRTVWLLRAHLSLSQRPALKVLMFPDGILAAARSPPGRWRCGLACTRASGPRGPRRRHRGRGSCSSRTCSRFPAPVAGSPELPAERPHGGGCSGGARVPGGAETAAERAADSGGFQGRRSAHGCFGNAVLAPDAEPRRLHGAPAAGRGQARAVHLPRAAARARGRAAPAATCAGREPPRTLLRVLPLPGDNWGALVDEWCCHPDPFANKPLHPRENDCFTGDCFYLVNLKNDLWQPRPEGAPVETHHLSSENHLTSKPKANTKVICKRCKVMLGETVSSETTKFYMTEIIILPSERNFPIIPRSQFLQSIIAQCMVELSSARSTFRFTIQGHDDKVYILLWLLNSDSLVIESLGQSTSIQKFPVLEDVLKADSSSAWNAVKVLYQPCIKSRNAELSSLWENDISVHSLTLPSTTCLELLLILSKSNATLPPSLRCMNSFQVAFLKM
ncbi:E3 ubiquitin-protein ligase E3D isoform X5 [Bubalus bubalis]|uniref:E3 ubiquitin-protein ligase E3D isoform X5 n=1 Tax=Bubalus bubalis TaxID=89462 RepID=UPI001E1B731F|nr:E3 ubiquitin-protein ligase E3D isoform X5 [Bubalus bubalis]